MGVVAAVGLAVATGGVARAQTTVRYVYDAAGRLTGAFYGARRAIAYRYDPAGNLVGRQACLADCIVGGSCQQAGEADAQNPCAVCDPARSTTAFSPRADGTSCGTGDACRPVPVCTAGSCVAVSAVRCTPSDACHEAGTCDPATGTCSNPARPDGASCDDGNACTRADTCQAGRCAGALVTCTAADACHAAGSCDPATGACTQPARPDGTTCDDGDACTGQDVCRAGACVGGSPVVCAPVDACHAAGTCDATTGRCSAPQVADGTPCDDADRCNGPESCRAGVCTNAGQPLGCDDGNPCTADACDRATDACTHQPIADGLSCADGDACNGQETCRAGACVAGAPSSCDDGNPCTTDTCEPTTGACTNDLAPDLPCDDGNPCTTGDRCDDLGACRGSPSCDAAAPSDAAAAPADASAAPDGLDADGPPPDGPVVPAADGPTASGPPDAANPAAGGGPSGGGCTVAHGESAAPGTLVCLLFGIGLWARRRRARAAALAGPLLLALSPGPASAQPFDICAQDPVIVCNGRRVLTITYSSSNAPPKPQLSACWFPGVPDSNGFIILDRPAANTLLTCVQCREGGPWFVAGTVVASPGVSQSISYIGPATESPYGTYTPTPICRADCPTFNYSATCGPALGVVPAGAFALIVTADPPSLGSVTKDPDRAYYAEGDQVLLTATPAPGAFFDAWSGSATAAASAVPVVMDGDKQITAHFDTADASKSAAATACADVEGEPIQTATGELYFDAPADLVLGGDPLPLAFVRRYASRLGYEGVVQSALGRNWVHNFDLRLRRATATKREVVFLGGRRVTFKWSGTEWVLKSPDEPGSQLRQAASGDFWFLDAGAGRLYRFPGADSRLLEIRDRNDNALALAHDADGRVVQVSDGLGRVLALGYTGANLTSVSDGTRQVTFAYASGLLTGATSALGQTTSYVYASAPAGAAYLERVVQPGGNAPHTQLFDALGRVTSQTDAYGRALTLRYDTPAPGSTTVIDAAGASSVHTHADQKVPTSEVDATGGQSSSTYDGSDRPLTHTDPSGRVTTFGYDESGRPASFTDARGDRAGVVHTTQTQTVDGVEFTFHVATRIDFPDGTHEGRSYDGRGNLVSRRDRAGQLWVHTYDARGRLLTETNPLGGVVTRTYNADGTQASETDSESGTLTFAYDAQRRLSAITYPDGSTLGRAYDAGNRVTAQTDGLGRVLRTTYDVNDNPVTRVDALGGVERTTYDLLDRIVEAQDRRGARSTYAFDAVGRMAATTDPNGNTTRYEYDPAGRPVRVTDALGLTTRFEYDAAGRKIATTSALGLTTRLEYDAVGNVTRSLDPLGGATTQTFDAMGRRTSATDAVGRRTDFAYDVLDRLVGVTFPGLGRASYSRDALGNLVALQDLLGSTWRFVTTPMGRTQEQVDPLGRRQRFAHDARGRLATVTHADGADERYTYDAAGNVTRIQYTDGSERRQQYDAANRLVATDGLALSYDAEGNLTESQDAGVAFQASYDLAGRLSELTYAGGALRVQYAYDAADRLVRVSDTSGASIVLTYDVDGRPTVVSRSSGVETRIDYDAAGRVTRLRDGALADQELTLDAAGQTTEARLTLPLDPASLLAGETAAFAYDAASQVVSAGYTHDARGRMTGSPGAAVTWDDAGRLRTLGGVTLTYNGTNDLVRRADATGATEYLHHHALPGSPIVAERNPGTGQYRRFYVWTPGGQLLYLLDAEAGNAPGFYHFDPAGSTLFLTGPQGTVTDAYAYTPYGVLLGHNGSSTQPFTFLGEHGARQESAGLYQIGVRYYDAALARFVSRDPAWPRLGDPSGLNPYDYARSNPIAFYDSNGRWVGAVARIFTKVLQKYGSKALKKRLLDAAKKKVKDEAKDQAKDMAKEAAIDQALNAATPGQVDPFAKTFEEANRQLERMEKETSPKTWTDTALDWVNPVAGMPQLKAMVDIVATLNIAADPGTSFGDKIRALDGQRTVIGYDDLPDEVPPESLPPYFREVWQTAMEEAKAGQQRVQAPFEKMVLAEICKAKGKYKSAAEYIKRYYGGGDSMTQTHRSLLHKLWDR